MEDKKQLVLKIKLGEEKPISLEEASRNMSIINEILEKHHKEFGKEDYSSTIGYIDSGCLIVEILISSVIGHYVDKILDELHEKIRCKHELVIKGTIKWSYHYVYKMTKYIIDKCVKSNKKITDLDVINKFKNEVPYSISSISFFVKNTKYLLEKYNISNSLISSKFSSVSAMHESIFLVLCSKLPGIRISLKQN